MRDRLLLIAIMLAIGTGAFLWWGGPGLLVVGAIATLASLSGLGGNFATNPAEHTWNPAGAQRNQPGSLAKKGAFLWGFPIALLMTAVGLYFFEVPGPLS